MRKIVSRSLRNLHLFDWLWGWESFFEMDGLKSHRGRASKPEMGQRFQDICSRTRKQCLLWVFWKKRPKAREKAKRIPRGDFSLRKLVEAAARTMSNVCDIFFYRKYEMAKKNEIYTSLERWGKSQSRALYKKRKCTQVECQKQESNADRRGWRKKRERESNREIFTAPMRWERILRVFYIYKYVYMCIYWKEQKRKEVLVSLWTRRVGLTLPIHPRETTSNSEK